MIPKDKRWQNKDYLKFVSEMPCSNCRIIDGTVVPHHLKHRYSPLDAATKHDVISITYKPYEYYRL